MHIQTQNMIASNIFQYNYQIRGFRYHRHIHRFSELVYIIDGNLQFTVGSSTYYAQAGDFIFIHPMQVHGYHSPDICNCIVCTFPNNLIGELITYSNQIGETPVFRCRESVAEFFYSTFVTGEIDGIGLRDDGRMPKSIDTHTIDYSDPAVRGRLQGCLMAVVGEYLRQVSMVPCPRDENVVVKLFEYLNEHACEPVTLASAAAELNYSANYLSHCIRTTSGMNFSTILASFRIEHAKQLMQTTNESVLNIAHASGFGSESSFQRMFSRIVGCTPTEYKKRLKSSDVKNSGKTV